LINAIAIFRFLTGAKIFQGIGSRAYVRPKANAGAAAGVQDTSSKPLIY